jgi:SAM-dependent methyltransferase
MIEKMTDNSRETGLIEELKFWDNWFASKGGKWPQDYNNRMDPFLPLQSDLSGYADRINSQHVGILDVGAGPLTKLGKTHPSKKISIIPTDLLAQQYDKLLHKYKINPIVRTQPVDAETLSEHFGYNVFEIVHAQNCLDHMAEPLKALQEMLWVTKPEGFVLLKHNECEGAIQKYHGMHQWDFSLHEDEFIVCHFGQQPINVSVMLRSVGKVECKKEGSSIVVIIQKYNSQETT